VAPVTPAAVTVSKTKIAGTGAMNGFPLDIGFYTVTGCGFSSGPLSGKPANSSLPPGEFDVNMGGSGKSHGRGT